MKKYRAYGANQQFSFEADSIHSSEHTIIAVKDNEVIIVFPLTFLVFEENSLKEEFSN